MLPNRIAIALCDAGWWVRSEIVYVKKSPMPESAKDRPTNAHEKIWMLTKHSHYYYDAEDVRVDTGKERLYTGGVKNSGWANSENYVGQDARHSIREKTSVVQEQVIRGHNMRNVMWLSHEPSKYSHHASFPSKMVEPLIKAATSEFGVCPECGAPWKRIIEKGFVNKKGGGELRKPLNPGNVNGDAKENRGAGFVKSGANPEATTESRTLGWEPTCKCHTKQELVSDKGVCVKCGAQWKRVGTTEHNSGKGSENSQGSNFARDGMRHDLTPETVTMGWEQTCDCETDQKPIPATVLDPFGGSGTTALVADRLKRDAILIELSPDYIEIAKKRIQGDSPLFVNIEVEE